jgi:primosomal protein N' (replication factor Y)
VLIQTRMPEHHAVRCALTHEYERFVREEMDGRCTPPYPPMVRLANVIVSGTVEEETAALAGRAATWVRGLLARAGDAGGGVRVVGPAPCPVERVKQRWRWHFLLKAEQPGPLGRTLRHLAVRFDVPKRHGLRLAIDRDPVALL